MSFSKNFVWGTATAAYQIEGSMAADGKGRSVWDDYSHGLGKSVIWEQDTGDIACDHYRRYREDVALMREMELKAYRFSISWPRVIPQGVGAVNAVGLAFYDKLVDELLAAGIDPWVTLFHWDYPSALFARGGWLNPESSDWFAEYASVVVEKLSDRVTNWMTLNEPQCFIMLGHLAGSQAPGLKLDVKQTLQAGHHALIAHGNAVQAIRAGAKMTPKIGWAPAGVIKVPATESDRDIEAARTETFAMRDGNMWNNTWWADPVVFGHYPEDGLTAYGQDAPFFTDAEMKTISQPLDFFGSNIYNGQIFRATDTARPEKVDTVPGHPLTTYEWKMMPEVLYWGPRFFHERYQLPIVITENGCSTTDWVCLDGKVHDPGRIDFIHRYLLQLKRAATEGIPIEGYHLWTLMDNFEWHQGHKIRMGMIHVDFGTQQRTLKDSALWYRDVIRSNGDNL